MKTTLYYFTGTGNSLKIARDLSEKLEDCELVPIAKIWQDENLASKSENVGFIFPLYYYGLPKIISDFLNRVKLDKTNYIFTVITMGGETEGAAFKQLEKILNTKSKSLNAGFIVSMPSNFMLDQDIYPNEEEVELLKNSIIRIENISEVVKKKIHNMEIDINQKKGRSFDRTNIAFQKNVYQSDEKFLADENCNNCGICEKVCPVNNIIIVEGKPQWQHKCQQCFACINYCPETAIQHGERSVGRGRYHHPDITVNDLLNQKQ